jgi:hypothetical protein
MPTSEIQPIIQNEMLLLKIIREICTDELDSLPFGHGMRSYANLETRKGIFETEKKFPRAYLYPVEVTSEFGKYSGMNHTYECMMDFLVLCKITDPQEVLESKLGEMFELSNRFIYKLQKHPQVMEVTDIAREPNYHVFDINLCGWVLNFKVKLNDEYCE